MQNLSSRLEQARKNAQLTRDEVVQLASQTSGFSRSSLQDWEQEGSTREPKLEYLLDLARIYGIHPWTLMSGEVLTTDHSLESMADIESLALNNLTNEPSNRNFPVPKWWLDERDLQVSQLVGYIYQGDTMSPTIANHAIIIVDKLQKQLIDGAVYVLIINSELFVRRVQRLPDGIRLINDNAKYTYVDISQEKLIKDDYLSVIGKVIFVGADFERL